MKCPPGKILREGTTVKGFTRADGTKVSGYTRQASCVVDKGTPGKGPKTLPVPKPGALGKYGYSNVKSMSAKDRRQALTKAVKKEGYAPIVRRLNLLANYVKVSDPAFHKLLRSDMKWIQTNLWEKYSKSAKRVSKSARKTGEVKAGTYTTRDGVKHQLYRVNNKKYYKYASGARRYV